MFDIPGFGLRLFACPLIVKIGALTYGRGSKPVPSRARQQADALYQLVRGISLSEARQSY